MEVCQEFTKQRVGNEGREHQIPPKSGSIALVQCINDMGGVHGRLRTRFATKESKPPKERKG